MEKRQPWQLDMFRKGLKKNLRLQSLQRQLIGMDSDQRCLLLTCGDNNGAMNYFLRELGGRWRWADLESQCIEEMSTLLGEPVHHVSDQRLPFGDGEFDRVVSIDVHEHLEDPRPITQELHRIAKPNGQIIVTVPNGDESKLAVRIKHALHMSKEAYGHTRVGLTVDELSALLSSCQIQPLYVETYSRFFTEMLELSINFVYVKLLRKSPETAEDQGEIAPATEEKLQSVSTSYRIYPLLFPIYWVLSKLDYLLRYQEGYCVLVAGRKLSP
jgi:2-polyprenyl-3-methyl-5-hydroxy-6-metoxy-1,4-benzoquinol methylase